MMGGFKELAEMRADIAAAYEDDMFKWSLVSRSTAAERARMTTALREKATGKMHVLQK